MSLFVVCCIEERNIYDLIILYIYVYISSNLREEYKKIVLYFPPSFVVNQFCIIKIEISINSLDDFLSYTQTVCENNSF